MEISSRARSGLAIPADGLQAERLDSSRSKLRRADNSDHQVGPVSVGPRRADIDGGRQRKGLRSENIRLGLYAFSLASDSAALVAAFLLTEWIAQGPWLAVPDIGILLAALSLFVMFSVSKEAQSVESLADYFLGLQRALTALAAAFVVQILLFFLVKIGSDISRAGFIVFFAASAMFLVASRLLLKLAVDRLLDGGVTSTLLLLDGPSIEPEQGMTVIDLSGGGLWPDLAKPDWVTSISRLLEGFDRVVVACEEEHFHAWSIFLQGSDMGGEIVVGSERTLGAVGIGRCSSRNTLVLSRGPLSFPSRVKKRAFDIAVSVTLIVLLGPVMLAVAAAIKLDSPGPALFRQTRVGKGNRCFQIVKFRSMRVDRADAAGAISAGRSDDRTTRVGAFIRKTSLDELPQLFNVLIGEMSLVGARPHALGSLAGSQLFWEINQRYWQRHAMRPGITGLAQVRGFRGPTDEVRDLENRLRCDLEYLSNWSLVLDLQILLATFRVLVHEKAY